MKQIRSLIAAALLIAGITPAIAQTFPTIPSQTVIGRTAFGPGPAQAIPFSQLAASFCSTVTLTVKGCLPPPGATTGRYYGDNLTWNALPSQQIVQGTGVTATGACSGTALNCTINATAATQYVVPSRAAAAASDLSALSSIQTLGYATPGDGGGATFKNIGSAPFIDSYITSFTIQGGSGYTNGGPYYGNLFQISGKPYAIGTVTVAGGAITAVNIQYTPSNQCAVGDVLSFIGSAAATASPANGLPAGGTGASITVTGCSTPIASFTDSAGNRWQYVPDGFPNVKQFGARGDWDGVDASATDDFNAIQSASWFAGFKSVTSFDGGGYWGGKVIFPSGSYMAGCSGTKSLVVANAVTFEGPSETGAQIKLCNTFSPATHFIEICDPNWHFACFGSRIKYMSLFADRNFGVTGGIVVVHTNNVQDFGGLDTVHIYAGQRGCIHFEEGYGGASTVSVQNVSCNGASTNTFMMRFGNSAASLLAYGTTFFQIKNIVIGGPSSCAPTCQTAPAILLQGGGFFDIAGVHCENAGENCITVDIPASANSHMVRLHNINAGWGAPATPCTGTIYLTAANEPGNTIIGMVPPGSCANVVLNGQPAGTNRTAAIVLDMVFNP